MDPLIDRSVLLNEKDEEELAPDSVLVDAGDDPYLLDEETRELMEATPSFPSRIEADDEPSETVEKTAKASPRFVFTLPTCPSCGANMVPDPDAALPTRRVRLRAKPEKDSKPVPRYRKRSRKQQVIYMEDQKPAGLPWRCTGILYLGKRDEKGNRTGKPCPVVITIA